MTTNQTGRAGLVRTASALSGKTASKKSATKKATTKKSTPKKAVTKKATTKRNTAQGTTGRTASLKADLKKFANEEYATAELTRGALVMFQREGMDAVRSALLALMGSKLPLMGNSVNDSAVESLVNQLADDYRKVEATDRKALRAVIHWLDGKVEVDAATANGLLATLNSLQA